jgi:TetR/AcrR family transcriptional repressor of nem operon
MPRSKAFDETEALKKAMHTFWKQGYNATSMQDLVDSMGINRASLYDTFGNKKELFERAFELYRSTNTRLLSSFLEKHEDTKEGFRRLFELAIDESVSDRDQKGCFVVNTTTEHLPDCSSIPEALQANQSLFEEVFYNYLKQGVDKGQLSEEKDLRSIARLIFTLYNGMKVVSRISAEKERLMATVDTALQVLD